MRCGLLFLPNEIWVFMNVFRRKRCLGVSEIPVLYQCPDGNCPFLVDIAPVHAGGDLNPRLRISLALFRTGLFKTGLTL